MKHWPSLLTLTNTHTLLLFGGQLLTRLLQVFLGAIPTKLALFTPKSNVILQYIHKIARMKPNGGGGGGVGAVRLFITNIAYYRYCFLVSYIVTTTGTKNNYML